MYAYAVLGALILVVAVWLVQHYKLNQWVLYASLLPAGFCFVLSLREFMGWNLSLPRLLAVFLVASLIAIFKAYGLSRK